MNLDSFLSRGARVGLRACAAAEGVPVSNLQTLEAEGLALGKRNAQSFKALATVLV